LSVLLRFAGYDYRFGIFKFFVNGLEVSIMKNMVLIILLPLVSKSKWTRGFRHE
jgi:hypothetical protein